MKCTKCGTENPQGSQFCQQCGARLEDEFAAQNGAGASPSGQAAGLSEDEVAFIGVKQDYYQYSFFKMRTTNNKVSWNWCAFFVFPYWAVYRKMYKEAVIYIVGTWGLRILLNSVYPGFVIELLAGLFGNWLYMRHVDTHTIAASGMPQLEKEAYFAKFGGVSSANVWILLAIMVGASIIWGIIAGMFFGFFSMLY
ncbi:zinc ribbon domain-containing protein [Pygmaiobacter massiliensis]|uniref:zinc ribbon domain-containing protein n=1 Tax=Pygmaiobacter massiliensis TaxID=1917873 RepID=UPI002A7FD976|nr:zinc ribbon domain-containing protein [Pygmaiobacter massiliensis]MDY4783510.1 zinc ribbon domain-containing protein [Pygmaiobacter massiliensis]